YHRYLLSVPTRRSSDLKKNCKRKCTKRVKIYFSSVHKNYVIKYAILKQLWNNKKWFSMTVLIVIYSDLAKIQRGCVTKSFLFDKVTGWKEVYLFGHLVA